MATAPGVVELEQFSSLASLPDYLWGCEAGLFKCWRKLSVGVVVGGMLGFSAGQDLSLPPVCKAPKISAQRPGLHRQFSECEIIIKMYFKKERTHTKPLS